MFIGTKVINGFYLFQHIINRYFYVIEKLCDIERYKINSCIDIGVVYRASVVYSNKMSSYWSYIT